MRPFGEYVLLGQLGRGVGAVVWEARHLAVDRPCALKILTEQVDPKRQERTLGRFLFEAEVLARLDHPAVVRVHGAGEFEGQRYIELELVEGGSLAEFLSQERPESGQAARWILQLAEALAHAHSRGVLHRDLKPGNVLLTAEGNLKLGDFGLAREIDHSSAWSRTLGAVGTPAFMAPEVAREGMVAFTPRSDIYGLGAVLYQMLTGVAPHAGGDALEVLDHVRNRIPRRPREVNPAVPADLEVICLRCLDPDPARRFASAQEVVEELQRHLSGQAIRSRADGPFRQLISWARRHRVVATSLAIITVLFLTGFALVSWQWLRADRLARNLTTNLTLARLSAAQRDLETGNGPRALAELAAAARRDDPEVEARRLLEFWLQQGAFVPPPRRVWSHDVPVVRALYSRNGRRILVQLTDGEAVVYPAESTNVLLRLTGVDLGQASVPGFDGTTLLARQTNGTLMQWSIPDSNAPPHIGWQVSNVQRWSVSAPPNCWSAVDADGGIWAGGTGSQRPPQKIAQLDKSTGWVAMAVSPTGNRILGGSRAPGWDLLETTQTNFPPDAPWNVRSLPGHLPELAGLVISPVGDRLLGFGGQQAELWGLDAGRREGQIDKGMNWVSGRFEARGLRILLADEVGNVVVASAKSGRISERDQGLRSGRLMLEGGERVSDVRGTLLTYPAMTIGSEGVLRFHPKTNHHYIAIAEHEAPVSSIALNPDQSLVLSGSEDGTVREWRRPGDRWAPDFLQLEPPLRFVVPMGPSNNLVGSDATGPFVWEPASTLDGLRRLPLHPTVKPIPGPSPGTLLAIDAGGKDLLSVDLTNPVSRIVHTLPEPALRLFRDPSGRRFAGAGTNQLWVTEWTPKGWSPLRPVALPAVTQCLLSRSDDRAWVLDADGKVHVLECRDPLRILPSPLARSIRQLDQTGDGNHLLLTTLTGEVQAWNPDLPTGPVRTLRLNRPAGSVVASSSDGLVAATFHRELRLWDSQGRRETLRIGGFDHPIGSMAFAPDGDVLAVSTWTDQLRLFSTRTGQPLTPMWSLQLRGRPSGQFSLAFTQDGHQLLGWTPSGRFFYLPLPHRVNPVPGKSDPLLDLADYLTGRRSSEDGRGTRILDPERDILRQRLAEARREGRWNPGWDRYWARGLAERP